MSLGGGGGGGGGKKREELVQSEREQLQEIERRMNMYENLYGDIERDLIQESYGILNMDLIEPYTEKIDALGDLAVDADKKLAKLRKDRDKIKKKKGFAGIGGFVGKTLSAVNDLGGGYLEKVADFYTEDAFLGQDLWTNDPNWKPGDPRIVEHEDGRNEEMMPQGGRWAHSSAKRKKINDEINEILNAQRLQKGLLEERTEAIKTQQANYMGEKVEQGRERASATVASAFGQVDQTRAIRDERLGIDPTENARAFAEREKEFALLEAAAEAGARNRSKSDIEDLMRIKQGAIVGGDLTDRAAADQFGRLGDSFMSRSANSADRAEAYRQQVNQATQQIAAGVGDMAGTGYGMATA